MMLFLVFTVGSVVAAGCADEEPLTLEWGDATLIEFNGGSASNPQVSLDSDGVNSDAVADRTAEGDLALIYPGVEPFPCGPP